MAKNSAKLKKAVSIALTVLSVLVFVFAAFVLTVAIIARSNGKQAVLFGYSFSVVLTDSMTPEIAPGELVTVKHCDISAASVGENAVFIAQSGAVKGERVIHKIIETGTDEGGFYIITQGVKAGATPDEKTHTDEFVGLGVAHSAFLGGIAVFFSRPLNWVFLIVFVFGIWLGARQIKKLVLIVKEDAQECDGDGTDTNQPS